MALLELQQGSLEGACHFGPRCGRAGAQGRQLLAGQGPQLVVGVAGGEEGGFRWQEEQVGGLVWGVCSQGP